VQHEYAHQVDFFLLSDVQRGSLAAGIGGSSWWAPGVGITQHGNLSSERFASTLAWSYWQSSKNSMKPRSKTDESAAMAPAAFKSLLGSLLAGGATQAA